jgi:hypothetical protein
MLPPRIVRYLSCQVRRTLSVSRIWRNPSSISAFPPKHPLLSSCFLVSIFYFLLPFNSQLSIFNCGLSRCYAQNPSAPEPSSPPILVDSATPVSRQELSEKVSSIERTSCSQPECRIYNPITVAEFAGTPKVKSIRVLHYARLNPPLDPKDLQKTLRRVWESSLYETPSCGIVWSEVTFWSIEASLDFDDGKQGLLITDGSHIALRDHDSHTWFFRLPPPRAIP